jgi:hypothetical protein
VSLNWKFLRAAIFLMVGSLLTGCSGIHMTKSVSPATFLLPGLMKASQPDDPNLEFPVQQPGAQVTKT